MERITTLIREFCENNNENCHYYEGYSGRGMCSHKCIGVVCKGNIFKEIVRLADFLHEKGISSAEKALGRIQMDSMGLDKIVYFPDLTFLR